MSNESKRTRSENWLQQDKNILKELVWDKLDIIENKNTDANTNHIKNQAWLEVLGSFNKTCFGTTRTLHQIKSQWSIIKMLAKKDKTGGTKDNTEARNNIHKSEEDESLPPVSCVYVCEEGDDANESCKPEPSRTQESEPPQATEREPQQTQESAQFHIQENHTSAPFYVEENHATEQERKRKKVPQKNVPTKTKINPAVARIAEQEIIFRREVHKNQLDLGLMQLNNEQHRSRLLELEEKVLKTKLKYFEKKIEYLDKYIHKNSNGNFN